MQVINKYRDKGSPCLIPLEGRIYSKLVPLTKIEVEIEETKLMISFTMP